MQNIVGHILRGSLGARTSRGLLALGGGAGGALVLAQDRLALLRGLLQELRPGTCGP